MAHHILPLPDPLAPPDLLRDLSSSRLRICCAPEPRPPWGPVLSGLPILASLALAACPPLLRAESRVSGLGRPSIHAHFVLTPRRYGGMRHPSAHSLIAWSPPSLLTNKVQFDPLRCPSCLSYHPDSSASTICLAPSRQQYLPFTESDSLHTLAYTPYIAKRDKAVAASLYSERNVGITL